MCCSGDGITVRTDTIDAAPTFEKDSMRALAQTLAIAACGVAACLPAQAVESFSGLGTTGLELGVAAKLGDSTGIHLDAELLNYKRTWDNDGNSYDTKLKFRSLGVYGNYFLTERFRLTGGVLLGSRKVTGTGVSSGGTITINGTTYAVAAGDSLTVDAKFPSASPYLGIGFGHADNGPGLGFYFDVGAVFGKPKVKLTPSANVVAQAGQANIDAEEAKLQDKMNKLRAYPAIKFGLSVGF